jgi:citrate lyase beta subunit
MNPSLTPEELKPALERLAAGRECFHANYSGDKVTRQPVHVMYGGAHLFRPETIAKLGAFARRSFEIYAPDWITLARVFNLGSRPAGGWAVPDDEARRLTGQAENDPEGLRLAQPAMWLAHAVHTRVAEKLGREPIEDYRIDFEDGYGYRMDEEEDRHAVTAAEACVNAPARVGIRIKPFTRETVHRAVRTLDLFVSTLVQAMDGRLPPGFVVALPKVNQPEQGAALAEVLDALEKRLGLPPGSIQVEVLVETPQLLCDATGATALPALRVALRGRLQSAHLGAFDYTAALQVTALHQNMTHPACEFARLLMQNALAGTGVQVVDGVTNQLPVPVHRVSLDGLPLTAAEEAENHRAVHAAWKTHHDHVRHALELGIYQGWDVHPAQLVPRFVAVFAFFLEDMEGAATRLRAFVDAAARATRSGSVFDDAASGQGLLHHFVRAVDCGALSEVETVRLTGLEVEEIRTRSFSAILERRGSLEP